MPDRKKSTTRRTLSSPLIIIALVLAGLAITLVVNYPTSLKSQLTSGNQALQTPTIIGDPWYDANKTIYFGPDQPVEYTDDRTAHAEYLCKNPLADVLRAVCLADNISETVSDAIAARCSLSQDNPLLNITCANKEIDKYFSQTSQDECCRDYRQAMDAIIPKINFGSLVLVKSTKESFEFKDKGSGHTVNRISLISSDATDDGGTLSYIYDAGWFPGTFFPANPFTVLYHQTFPGLPKFFADIGQSPSPPANETIFVKIVGGSVIENAGPAQFTIRIVDDQGRLTPNETGVVVDVVATKLTDAEREAILYGDGKTKIPDQAIQGFDYIFVPRTYYIPPGQSSRTLPVEIIDDDIIENTEAFALQIVPNPVGPRPLPDGGQAPIVIFDDDSPSPDDPLSIFISISCGPTYEGDEANVNIMAMDSQTFANIPAPHEIKITLDTSDASANANSDYVPLNNHVVTISPGESQTTLTIPTIDDNIVESTEYFFIDIRSLVGANTSGNSFATCLIDDNDSPDPSTSPHPGDNQPHGGGGFFVALINWLELLKIWLANLGNDPNPPPLNLPPIPTNNPGPPTLPGKDKEYSCNTVSDLCTGINEVFSAG